MSAYTKRHQLNEILATLARLETKMAKIDDELAAVSTALTNTQADVTKLAAGIDSLHTQITDLQTQLANAGLTSAQQAALDAVAKSAADLNTASDAAAAKLP